MTPDLLSRVYGCMAGLAIGDAFGMPGQLTPEATRRAHGGPITDFVAPPPSDATGHAGLRAGQVTDDTLAMLAVVRSVLRTGGLTREAVAEDLVAWIDETDGLNLPYVGPSTKRAITALKAGVSPSESGREGWTNGAAMRVAPVGFLHAPDLEATARAAVEASYPTHATSTATSGAAAVACAVAACVSPETGLEDLIEAACRGADLGETQGVDSICPSISRRIRWAVGLVSDGRSEDDHLRDLYDLVGTGMPTYEIVPSALAVLVMADGDPVRAIRLAANAGGDCDTLAAIAGAIAGAYRGIEAFPQKMLDTIEAVNGLELERVAREYYQAVQRIRQGGDTP